MTTPAASRPQQLPSGSQWLKLSEGVVSGAEAGQLAVAVPTVHYLVCLEGNHRKPHFFSFSAGRVVGEISFFMS